MPIPSHLPPLPRLRSLTGTHLADPHRLRAGLTHALSALCGVLFAFTSPFKGLSPLGPAAVAVLPHPLSTAVGAFAGSMLDPRSSASHAAAVLLTYACRLIFSARPLRQQRQVLPLCAAVGLLLLQLPLAARGPETLILALCEAILCWGGGILLHHVRQTASPLHRWSALLPVCCGLLLLQRLLPLPVCAPARCLCVVLLLLCTRFLGSGAAAATGLLLGVTMDLSGGSAPFFSLVYCTAGLCTGLVWALLAQRSRQQLVLIFTLFFSASLLWGYSPAISATGFLECVTGCLFFLFLPKKLLARMEQQLCPSGPAVSRPTGIQTRSAQLLQSMSGAVASLGLALDDLQTDPRDDPEHLCRRAGAGVCRGCAAQSRCWQRDYESTRDAFSALAKPLQQKGSLDHTDLPTYFSARCLHPRQLCTAINDAYRRLLRRQAAEVHAQEQQKLMRQQYQGLQGVLRDLASSLGLGQEYFPALEKRVGRVAKAYLPDAIPAVYTRSGRLHVELLCRTIPDTDEDALRRSLSSALGKPLLPPLHLESRSGQVLRFSQQEAFCLRLAHRSACKPGETQSGDSLRHLHTDDGRGLLLLSDGMGTGASAGFTSGRALDLICGFVESGCSLAESTQAVLPVLSARFPRWGFVTLDLLEINLFTGEALLLKYGAAPSLLFRGSKIQKLTSSRLPAGLEEAAPPGPEALTLLPGDRILLLSDGLWESIGVRKALEQACAEDLDALCDRLMALAAQDGVQDDCTLLAADFSVAQA